MSAKLSKDALKTHDAASLIVTVTGKGNVSLVEAPKLDFPPDFEVYDVKATSATDKSGTNGSKTFEYPFIPRSPGDFVLPPVRFSYYDVKSRRYATAQTDSLRLTVERGAGGAAQPAPDGAGTLTVDRKGVKNLGEDIRFIKTKTSLSEDKGFFVGKPAYWLLVALLLLGAAGSVCCLDPALLLCGGSYAGLLGLGVLFPGFRSQYARGRLQGQDQGYKYQQ